MGRKDIKAERFKEFLAEAEDILNSMDRDLLRLEKGVKAGVIDTLALNSVFRSAHTLKGISGIFDLKNMTELSHALEDTLDMLRLGRVAFTEEVLGAALSAHGLLAKIISAKCENRFASEVSRVKDLLSRSSETKPEETRLQKEVFSGLTEYESHRLRENLHQGKNIFVVSARFKASGFDRGYVSLTEALGRIGEVIATLPGKRGGGKDLCFEILAGTTLDRDRVHTLSTAITEAEVKVLKEGRRPAEHEKERAEAKPLETLRKDSNTVRVNIEKLDHVINTISELGILKTNLGVLADEIKARPGMSIYGLELSRLQNYLERKFSELRDSVLDVRMVPIGRLFGRFETFIGRLSRESGKEIAMQTYGDKTELDKLIIEELADPLMHIVRNVIDHGIESPSLREAKGKPRAGTVTLGAFQKGNHVVVEVKDDGAGIDEELVCRKAVEKGLISDAIAAGLSRQEKLHLIMLPGFTTTASVSEISGRGIGLDVVKDMITRHSGAIEVETEKGKGTRFILTVPSTLAIIQALIVEERGERYAVPLNSVLEIVEVKCGGTRDHVTINGRSIPSVRLSRFFGSTDEHPGGMCYGIVAGVSSHRLCVVVERLVEECDVVIKPLPGILKVPGVAGATDMGERGTVLVLDLTGLLEHVATERKFLKPESSNPWTGT